MSNYYDKEGKPIDLMEWGSLLNNFDYQVIKQEELPNGKWVSTVWLGLDHNFYGGKPLIFETIVFSSKSSYDEVDVKRYSSLKEAEDGHKCLVAKHSQV